MTKIKFYYFCVKVFIHSWKDSYCALDFAKAVRGVEKKHNTDEFINMAIKAEDWYCWKTGNCLPREHVEFIIKL